MLENFDSDNGIGTPSTAHKILNSEKDLKCIVTELLNSAVFYHPLFNIPRVPLRAKPETELID